MVFCHRRLAAVNFLILILIFVIESIIVFLIVYTLLGVLNSDNNPLPNCSYTLHSMTPFLLHELLLNP